MNKNTYPYALGGNTKYRELSWFAERVERGRAEPFTEIMTITPAMAARMLENNDNNRPPNNWQIKKIAKDIVNGLWQVNGETIIVSKEGLLNDGQNRLMAIVEAGQPVTTAVAFGVSRESRMSVDMGIQRTVGHFLSMSGVKNSTVIAAVVQLLHAYRSGFYGNPNSRKTNGLTKQEILAAYSNDFERLDEAVGLALSVKSGRPLGATAVATAYILIKEVNSAEAAKFFEHLLDGANLPWGSPILSLRTRLLGGSRLIAFERLELILRTWNMWREGKTNAGRSAILSGSYPKIAR